MQGSFIRFYVREDHRHQHRPLWEWLLEQANKIGVRGGSAFKAMAGFGQHHVMHEAKFFELAGSLAIEVKFIVTDDEANSILALLRAEKIRVLYVRTPAEFGSTDEPSSS